MHRNKGTSPRPFVVIAAGADYTLRIVIGSRLPSGEVTINHLEKITAEWLGYRGYFVRTGVRVGARAKGGWDGELDIVGFHPANQHFLHIECSFDADTWADRETKFAHKFLTGRKYAHALFSGMELPTALDQVVVHSYASAADQHRDLGGGRLITHLELTAEILFGIPSDTAKSAVSENYPLLRTLQFAKMAAGTIEKPKTFLIPSVETSPTFKSMVRVDPNTNVWDQGG